MEQKERDKIIKFIESSKNAHFLQSPEWAEVKSGWKNEFAIAKNDDGEITGIMSILLKKMPVFGFHMMYAPRGFVCDRHDKETLSKLTDEVKKVAKKYKGFILRIDPDVPNNDENFKQIIQDLGYNFKSNIKGIDDVIQPKFVMRIDISGKTEEEVMMNFHSKTRYNIKLAIKKGVTVREGTKNDLQIFYDILEETSKRDKFVIRDISYYEKILDKLGAKHAKILIAEFEGNPIAVAMPILYGNKVWYLFGGSKSQMRNLMPTYLIQWEMIKWAINEKCDIYDFRGVTGFENENSPQYGVYRFKKGFGGEVVEFVDELQMVFKPAINKLWNIIYKIYSKI